ncbi:MAG TPA: flagellar FliJ family protein [Rhizomicrobium sp.]|jgi:flagellar export protein FliJ|nr:flagellar FliJ family protein [Rhizomicrobium sp.]
MNRTDSLLRLKRFRVDEMKRRLGSIAAMRLDLEHKLTDLDDNVVREKQRAGDSDIGRLAFPSFLRSIDARRENLRTTMKDIEREYAVAQGELAEAFQELKSLEIAAEQQERRVAELQERQAQTRMDEIAIVRHLRKHAVRTATR